MLTSIQKKIFMREFKYLSFLFLLILISLGCSTDKSRDIIVAKIGLEEITKTELNEDFILYPIYRSNSTYREALLQQLNSIGEERQLYLAALEEKFDTLKSVQVKTEYILHKEMLKKLYDIEVLNKIEVTEEEAWEEYKKQNTAIAARHLFTKDKNEIEYLHEQLINGDTFENLATGLFQDSVLANNGGYLGYLNLSDFDPLIVDFLYNKQIGKISEPIQSSYGYHIFKVEDVKQKLFLDKNYFQNNIDEFKRSVQNRRAASQSGVFVKETLQGKTVNINGGVLARLADLTGRLIADRSQQAIMLQPKVTDREIYLIKNEAEIMAESTLVNFTGGEWTVGEFIKKIQQMPPSQRPIISNENSLAKSIIDLVRDEYLVQEAYRQNLDQNNDVKESVEKIKKEVLANEFQKTIQLAQYKQIDPRKWKARREILKNIKAINPIEIDTVDLFGEIPETKLLERLPLIKVALHDRYKW
ncbi:MAG: peptidylprolyl isomerase [Melioribacteraceae bacterium]|nr:peptidylprolyl isomerase [Melioribacteraceae bacterium]MCF8265201.1 peptidylprolyl isomerase [Melioribacteraceae bacterium]